MGLPRMRYRIDHDDCFALWALEGLRCSLASLALSTISQPTPRGEARVTEPPSNDSVVAKVLTQLPRLATLPSVAVRVTEAAEDSDISIEGLRRLVSSDPVIASRLLKVVNSSFYGRSGGVKSIEQAIVILGLNGLRSLVLAASLAKLFRRTRVHEQFDDSVFSLAFLPARGEDSVERLV